MNAASSVSDWQPIARDVIMSDFLTLPNGRKIEILSDEEDAVLTAAALSDPANPPITDFSGFKRMGRPPLADPKVAVKLRLDADVVAKLRASGKGWQTRINQALRDYVTTHSL